jgi:hypothetical protein
MFRAGQLDYDIAFNLASYIKKESRFVPWRALLDNIGYLDNMLRKHDIYGKFFKVYNKFLMKFELKRSFLILH